VAPRRPRPGAGAQALLPRDRRGVSPSALRARRGAPGSQRGDVRRRGCRARLHRRLGQPQAPRRPGARLRWAARRDAHRGGLRRGDRVVIRPAELIQRKRDGEELGSGEITELILGYARGEVPDYQLAAFCMAVYFRGLSPRETYALTEALIESGETVDLGAALGRKVVDKHSTGGVGDKTSLAVAPIVAACGVPFGKM